MHLPEKFIRDAIHNPLLFQQNNPLISQSMSLLNSRHKKSGNDSRQMQQFTSKQMSARMRKKYDTQQHDQFQQSSNGQYDIDSHDNQNQEDFDDNQMQNQRAIKQFQRQIQQKFKISVANKIYTFPRLKITSIMDIISSSQEQEDNQENIPSKSTSQLTDTQFNPFNQKFYKKNIKTQKFQENPKPKENLPNIIEDRNFKKVKILDKKDNKQKKNSSKKEKEPIENYSHRQKIKNVKKNPQVTTISKEKNKVKNQTQKIEKASQKLSNTKNQKPWVVKQSKVYKHNYGQRLKTQMDRGSSGISESITQSKKRFYEQQFFMKK